MTVIVAAKDLEGNLVIGADSQLTAGNERIRDRQKLIRIGEYVIGCSWSCHVTQHIEDNIGLFKKIKIKGRKDIVDIAKCYKKILKLEDIDKDSSKAHEFWLLIIWGGSIWEIDWFFGISEHKEWWAIGSGSDFAKGVMSHLYDGKYVLEDVETALNIACDNDIFCWAPVYFQHITNDSK